MCEEEEGHVEGLLLLGLVKGMRLRDVESVSLEPEKHPTSTLLSFSKMRLGKGMGDVVWAFISPAQHPSLTPSERFKSV